MVELPKHIKLPLECGFSIDYNAPGTDGDDCIHGLPWNEAVDRMAEAKTNGWYAMLFVMRDGCVIDLYEVMVSNVILQDM